MYLEVEGPSDTGSGTGSSGAVSVFGGGSFGEGLAGSSGGISS